jgi:hypothetical protein
MAKTTKSGKERQAAKKAAYHKQVHAALARAEEAGFKHRPGRGFWKALRAWCEAHGVKHPAVKSAQKAAA